MKTPEFMPRGTVGRVFRLIPRIGPAISSFWRKSYEDNLTGLAGMVAYNLLLSIFPLALLALFIAGRVLESSELQLSVLNDLRELFPTVTESTLSNALESVRRSSTQSGIFALVASVWVGASFWGALDSAFCRIYHVDCRSWLQQKRFALAMLGVVLLLIGATIAVPTIQSLLVSGADDLPFGLSEVRALVYGFTLALGLLLVFAMLCLIYAVGPNCLVPWRAIWPGAAGATIAIGIVDYAFPFYLSHVSAIGRFGTTMIFVLIVLLWFYALAIIILGGAVLNALRWSSTPHPRPAAQGRD